MQSKCRCSQFPHALQDISICRAGHVPHLLQCLILTVLCDKDERATDAVLDLHFILIS